MQLAGTAARQAARQAARPSPAVASRLPEPPRLLRRRVEQAAHSGQQRRRKLRAVAAAPGLAAPAEPTDDVPAGEPPLAAAPAAVALLPVPMSTSRLVLAAACVAALLAAVHRVAFSVLAIPLQQQLGLSMGQMGALHSALLAGYLVAQVPSGLLADRLGGAHLLLGGLLAWSLACLSAAAAPAAPSPFVFLLVTRAALGLGQSVLMPAVSALAARWFDSAHRSRSTGSVYASFSAGSVVGLVLTPPLATAVGWARAFAVLGACGVAAALVALARLPREPEEWRRGAERRNEEEEGAAEQQQEVAKEQQQQQQQQQRLLTPEQRQQQEAGRGAGAVEAAAARPWSGRSQLALLVFAHSVISLAFFICQAWTPHVLHEAFGLGGNLNSVGLLSALPWLCTALVGTSIGGLADWLQARRRWPALRVRRVMQSAAFAGTALALLPLALGARSGAVTLAALVVAIAMQGLNYSGFHAHVQDIAPSQAGLVLGITNTAGILAGIAGNLATGHLAHNGAGFQPVFALTAALSAVAALVWWRLVTSKPLRLAAHG